MGIVKKTKEERKADAANVLKSVSRDTPLSSTPEVTEPVTDLKSALADINARSAARQKTINDRNKELAASRMERSREKRSIAGDGGRLYGLASFAGTTGRKVE